MTAAKPPRLMVSGLTGRIYITTSYKRMPDGSVISNTKYDVTDEFEAIETSRKQERQASKGKTAEPRDASEQIRASLIAMQAEAGKAAKRLGLP